MSDYYADGDSEGETIEDIQGSDDSGDTVGEAVVEEWSYEAVETEAVYADPDLSDGD